MQLSPTRQPLEPLSVFRFRYALFSFKCGIGFGLALAVWVALRPDVNRSFLSSLVMFLYFGLPIGLGMSVLSSFGFFIGGLFAHWLEQSASARRVWPRIRFSIGALISVPISLFCFYWLFRGLTTMETQALARGGASTNYGRERSDLFLAKHCRLGHLGFRYSNLHLPAREGHIARLTIALR